jgi:large subunit ribosomal protein L30
MSAATATKTSANKKRTITIRMKKSKIACPPQHRAAVTGLGLKRPNDTRTLENTPSVRGMIKKVLHLVEVVSETR